MFFLIEQKCVINGIQFHVLFKKEKKTGKRDVEQFLQIYLQRVFKNLKKIKIYKRKPSLNDVLNPSIEGL